MTANPRYAGAARRLSDRIEPTWVDAFVHERSPGVICSTGAPSPSATAQMLCQPSAASSRRALDRSKWDSVTAGVRSPPAFPHCRNHARNRDGLTQATYDKGLDA